SPPTRSTRLAAQRRRRRCASVMGSRVLRSRSPPEPLSGWHSARQSQTTTAAFTGFFEVGGGRSFLEIERKRTLIRRASRAVVCRVHAVAVPIVGEDCSRFMPQARRRLRLSAARPLSFTTRALNATGATAKQSSQKSALIMLCIVG